MTDQYIAFTSCTYTDTITAGTSVTAPLFKSTALTLTIENSGGEDIVTYDGAATKLFYNNVEKLVTTNTGISVTATVAGTDGIFSGIVQTDTINENTGGSGVTVDSLLIKDGGQTSALNLPFTDGTNTAPFGLNMYFRKFNNMCFVSFDTAVVTFSSPTTNVTMIQVIGVPTGFIPANTCFTPIRIDNGPSGFGIGVMEIQNNINGTITLYSTADDQFWTNECRMWGTGFCYRTP